MTDLLIATLTATVTESRHGGVDGDRVRRLSNVADRQLAAATDRFVADGDWCVKDVSVTFQLDERRPETALEAAWAEELARGLASELAGRRGADDRGETVLHYPRRSDAVADLLAAAAVGRFDRAWAWRLLDLYPGPGTPTAEDVLRAVLRIRSTCSLPLSRDASGRCGRPAPIGRRAAGKQSPRWPAELSESKCRRSFQSHPVTRCTPRPIPHRRRGPIRSLERCPCRPGDPSC